MTREVHLWHRNWKRGYTVISICILHESVPGKLRESIVKITQIIKYFIRGAGYKIDINKSIIFIYTNK